VRSTIEWEALYPNWPSSAFPLPIGTNTYSAEQCLEILQYPGDYNDGLNPLAKELVAEGLNKADGANHYCIDEMVDEANARIMSLVPRPIGTGFILRSTVNNLINGIADYNKGNTCCADHCNSN
jgi:hypothetical protein